VKSINLTHVWVPECHLQGFFQFKEVQKFPEVFILFDNAQQATANCYENSATYVCFKLNSSCHKVSISYTTSAVGTLRSVTFSQTVTKAQSSVTQYNITVLLAVSSSTVHKRYTDRLLLYRQGFDFTKYTAFQKYTQRQGLKLQLDWE